MNWWTRWQDRRFYWACERRQVVPVNVVEWKLTVRQTVPYSDRNDTLGDAARRILQMNQQALECMIRMAVK